MKNILALAFIYTLFMQGCCSKKNVVYHEISDETISKLLPYTNFQSLHFLKNGSDTVKFVAGEMIRSDGIAEPNMQGGLCGETVNDDLISLNFKNLTYPGKDILFSIYFRFIQDDGNPQQYFSILLDGQVYEEEAANIGPTIFGYSDSVLVNGNYYRYQKNKFSIRYMYYNAEEGIIKFNSNGDTFELIK